MIEILSGTNRPNSNSLKLANVLLSMYRQLDVEAQVLDLQEMPIDVFRPESYGEKPEAFRPHVERVLACDGLHVVTPEYNGSFPGVLKYFIDMLPFPSSFEHRCVAFTGHAAGVWGAFRAVEQLQMVFGYRNAYILPERVWIPQVNSHWGEEGGVLTSSALNERLRQQCEQFRGFVERNKGFASKAPGQ